MSAVPIHTVGLALGVAHHQGGGHLRCEERDAQSHSRTLYTPGFIIIRVIPSAALQQRIRRDFRIYFYTCLCVYSTLCLGEQR